MGKNQSLLIFCLKLLLSWPIERELKPYFISKYKMNKILISILALQLIVWTYLWYGLWQEKMLSTDIGNTILVGMTTDYTAPVGYFEYYMWQEAWYQNKYFWYYMSQYNIWVNN